MNPAPEVIDFSWPLGIKACELLRAAGLDARYEHPGYIDHALNDERNLTFGTLEGYWAAQLQRADGYAFDEDVDHLVNPETLPLDATAETIACWVKRSIEFYHNHHA